MITINKEKACYFINPSEVIELYYNREREIVNIIYKDGTKKNMNGVKAVIFN